MAEEREVPDHTAVRVALWRAMHLLVDAPPHVVADEVGLRLADPDECWRERQDMDPVFTSGFRAWVVARARFLDDLVTERSAAGVGQYVILGAGLDSFAQRRPDLGRPGQSQPDRAGNPGNAELLVFEVDQPETQAWKRERLTALGYGTPDWLRLVPVDFESGESWWDGLAAAGFDAAAPAVASSTGVSMYLTREANAATLRQLAALAPGSTVAMTFQPPLEFLDEQDRQGRLIAERGAAASGTPFISFFSPQEFLAMARDAGFKDVRHVSGSQLQDRYFAGRPDGLRLSTGEDFLVATT